MKPDRPLTPAERQQRRRDRLRADGLEKILLVVPRSRIAEIRALAADWVAKYLKEKRRDE